MFLLFIKFKFLMENGVSEKIKAHSPSTSQHYNDCAVPTFSSQDLPGTLRSIFANCFWRTIFCSTQKIHVSEYVCKTCFKELGILLKCRETLYLTRKTTFSKKVNPMKYPVQTYILVRTWNLLFIYFTLVCH